MAHNSIAAEQELKGLRSQLAVAEGTAAAELKASQLAAEKSGAAHAVVRALREQIKQLEHRIKEVEPVVSEHAILRYLERVRGLDLEEVRLAILDHRTVDSIKFARNGKIKKNDYTVAFKDNVVTTILVPE